MPQFISKGPQVGWLTPEEAGKLDKKEVKKEIKKKPKAKKKYKK